jgi:hypothetical protein
MMTVAHNFKMLFESLKKINLYRHSKPGFINHIKACKGQSLVEFAVVLPAMAILLLGVMAVGRFLFTLHDVSSHARGLHKNSMRYASSNNVVGLIKSDLGSDYNVRIRGSSKHAMVVQATKEFEPFGNLIPALSISGSTSMPANIIADVTGSSLADGTNYTSNPGGAIILATTFDFQSPSNCPEQGYCIGTNLEDPSLTPSEFFHLPPTEEGELQTLNMPTIVPFSNGANCEIDSSGMVANEFSYDTDGSTQSVDVHPLCPEDDNECLSKKETNIIEYLDEHINIIDDNDGCNGEPTYPI